MVIRILVLFLLTCSLFASATELVIYGNQNKPPKIYLENSDAKGILVDILAQVEDETGERFDIKLYPWARAYNYAKHAQGGIVGLSKTKERLDIFDYSDAVYYDEIILVVRAGEEFNFNSINDLGGKTIGIGRAGSYGDEYETAKNDKLFQVEEDSDPVFRLKKLLHSRIDVALIGPGLVGFNSVVNQDPELQSRKHEFYVIATPFKRDANFLGFHKSLVKKAFLQKFNQALKKAEDHGEIDKIIGRYVKQ
ncbi:transporter substrate-binding domain-containing protein [Vibrio profundum]|uniref:substrate-binding periplasmic protein n=1 Tax=Vibrio profundum TaxID=2910247 RepID=UPI003D10DFFF